MSDTTIKADWDLGADHIKIAAAQDETRISGELDVENTEQMIAGLVHARVEIQPAVSATWARALGEYLLGLADKAAKSDRRRNAN